MKLFHRSKPASGTDIVLPEAGSAHPDHVIVIPEQRAPADGLEIIRNIDLVPAAGEGAAAETEPKAAWPRRARLAFRRWRHTRPFWGGLWTVLAGFQIAYGPATAYKLMFVTNSVWIGVSVGVFIFAMGLFIWFTPRLHQLYGLIVVIASLVSLLTSDLGGFLIGMLLGIIGGSMAFAWLPVGGTVKRRGHHRSRSVQGTTAESVTA